MLLDLPNNSYENIFNIFLQDDYEIYIQSSNGGHYEVYLNQPLSWDDAWVKCQNKGGRLAVIDSLDEKQFIVRSIKTHLSNNGGYWKNLWLGLRKGSTVL